MPELSRGEYIRAIMGGTHRLDIWSEIYRYPADPPEEFYFSNIMESLDTYHPVDQGRLYRELTKLAALDMVERLTLDKRAGWGEKKAPMIRLDSPVWGIVPIMQDAVDILYPGEY